MPAMLLHFFDKDDPNGDTIFECSTDDEFVKQVQLRIERDSMGGGTVNFARKTGTGLISRNIVVPETLVRVVIPEIDSDKYLWGFFINPRQQQVISKAEQGGEGFTFGGPGPKHYLYRAVLRAQSFTGIQDAIDDIAGVWTWPETASAGRILSRLISEDAGAAGPTSMLPDLTKTFSLTQDSDSVAWVDDISSNQDFSLKIGDDFLKLLWILEDASGMITHIDLGSIGSPTLQLEAWQTKGRDLTGDLAADTVHFIEGVNIATDLNVEGTSMKKASHALVIGQEGQYTVAMRPGWSAGELKRMVTTTYPSSNDDVLERAGQRFLNRQENGEREIELRIVPGFDPEEGLYMPGPPGTDGHFWLWDTVDLTTGMSLPTVLDYQAEPQSVTGIELELTDAVRDDDAESVARSFEVTVILNRERQSSNTGRDLAGNRGSVIPPAPILKPCRPSTISESEAAFIGDLGGACSSSGTNVPSEYPPWAAAGEERVEITAAQAVPEGGTILVGVSTNRDGPNASRDKIVYDQRGNTYILDAESDPQGTSDHMTQVWRSVLDTAIGVGDWIRFATKVGSDTSASGGRCMAAAAWDGALTSPVVGLDADAFNATPTVASSAVADVTFVSVAAADSDGVTGDADWTNLHAYGFQSGSGASGSGLLTEYLSPGDGQGWTGGIDQSRDWSLVTVGYSAGGESSGSVNDGHPDLVGDPGNKYANCGHRHDVHRDVEPTVDDDESLGYPVGTIWVVLDDLDSPTEILSVWVLADATDGAAVWLEWPGGTDADIETLSTSETDTALVLHPDGAGGVEWGTDATGSSGGIGEILISDTPSTPLVFADLIQNEAQDDLVYGDI